MERRDLLKLLIKVFSALLLLGLPAAIVSVYPSRLRRPKLHYVYLMDDDELPRKGVKRITYQYTIDDRTVTNRVFLSVTDRGVVAFSPVCSHLGCFVNWDSVKLEFICPCHGGKYTMSGEVTAGPPPRPLTELPLRISEGRVYLGVTI
jgi:cytochrome b6-f complex iron-sulfur subunit